MTVVVAQDVNSEYATALAELLELLRSAEVELTVALSTYPPGALGIAVTLIVAVLSLAREPKVQLIVVVPLQPEPWLGTAETSVNPLGIVSVAVTPVALDGPEFFTVTV